MCIVLWTRRRELGTRPGNDWERPKGWADGKNTAVEGEKCFVIPKNVRKQYECVCNPVSKIMLMLPMIQNTMVYSILYNTPWQ